MMRILLLPLLSALACQNALDQRLAIVSDPRILAVVSEPPETAPGGAVMLTALVADRNGSIDRTLQWSWCTAPKPPTEDNAVAAGCLADPAIALGDAAAVVATVPSDACRSFGPDVASIGFRPRDPDPTGGYYQPARALSANAIPAFGFTRISCNLARAPSAVAQAYKTEYVANRNPILAPLVIDGTVSATEVPRDREVTLVAMWPAEAAETYLYYDPAAQRLRTRREAMRVSWFATDGTLAADASSVGEDDDQNWATTTWKTPDSPGTATLWLVLRDSRGGIATQTIAIIVR